LSNFIVRKAAVLGAGVMGAQIAAHLANAEVPVVLFDLPAKEGDPNGIVRKAIDALGKLEPSPLATKDRVGYIDAANYSQHLDLLRDCDLIIEAIAEKTEWKDDLYRQIAPFVSPAAIIASNTSGLSINRLSEGAAGSAAFALLRHPLLQSAALHASRRTDRDQNHRSGVARPSRSPGWSRASARASCVRAIRRTSSPTASVSSRCSR
jgi:ketopantoate reductase